jgi:hypothetical protein
MFIHEAVDVTKRGRITGGNQAHWGRGLYFIRHDPVCHQLTFPLCDPRHVAADPARPHFRHVIISTLRAGPAFLQDWIGGSGHVDRSSDHGFAQRPGASGSLRRQIKQHALRYASVTPPRFFQFSPREICDATKHMRTR